MSDPRLQLVDAIDSVEVTVAMNQQFKYTIVPDTVEKLKRKYLERSEQV